MNHKFLGMLMIILGIICIVYASVLDYKKKYASAFGGYSIGVYNLFMGIAIFASH